MTMLERLELMREIQSRIEELPEMSRVMSVATFTPESTKTGIGGADRSADYAKNKSLEEHRDKLLAGDYLRMEHDKKQTDTGRELGSQCPRRRLRKDDSGGRLRPVRRRAQNCRRPGVPRLPTARHDCPWIAQDGQET